MGAEHEPEPEVEPPGPGSVAEVPPEAAGGSDGDGAGDGDASSPGAEGWEAGWAPEAELERLRAERDDYVDSLRRLQADFDNFRKRTARDQAVTAERLVEGLVVQLLPTLDALEMALTAAEGEADDGVAKLRTGFELMANQLLGVLGQAGLERIDAADAPFDPELHEAVMQVDEGREEPTVVDVLRTGYRFKQRVVRPAMVRVAK